MILKIYYKFFFFVVSNWGVNNQLEKIRTEIKQIWGIKMNIGNILAKQVGVRTKFVIENPIEVLEELKKRWLKMMKTLLLMDEVMVLGKIYHSLVILAIFGMLVGFELLVKVCVIGMLINTVVLLYYMIKGE